jgi:Rieske Fe-S protein
MAAGAVATLIPLFTGITSLFDPLLKKGGGEAGMVLVTRLSVLPDNGAPQKFTVKKDKVDAWTTYRNTPVGAVYLRKTQAGVEALNVVCPHAGCFVNVAEGGGYFACPCHKSSFQLDGSIRDPDSPSPRPMDSLQVEVRNDDEIWVKFENFLPGREEKVPVA